MTDSRIVQLLKSFDETELKQFSKHIETSGGPLVKKLFTHLYEHAPDFNHPTELETKLVRKKIYTKKPDNTSNFTTLCNALTKLIEDYLIFLQYQKDKEQRAKTLNKIYGERNIAPRFQKTTKELLDKLEKQPYQDADYFYNKYLLQRDLVFHVSTPRQGTAITENIKAALDNLYQFYSIERLRLGLDLKNRERIFNESHEFELTDDLSTISEENILYKILKEIFYLFKTEEEERFFRAKKLFFDNIGLLNLEDGLNILLALINYAMQQGNKQNYEYRKETFSLYKEGIKSKILLLNNSISGATFLNIVMVSTTLKDFQYAKTFMEEHVSLLDETLRDNIEQFSLSCYYFHKQEYQKAANILSSFKSSNILYMISMKVLELQNHYEGFEENASYFHITITTCASFKRYLKRKIEHLSFEKKDNHLNFVILLEKITKQKKLILDGKKTTLDLMALLNKRPNIIAREWLKTIIKRINKQKHKQLLNK